MKSSIHLVDEPMLNELMNSIIKKITIMSDKEVEKIDLSSILEPIPPELKKSK